MKRGNGRGEMIKNRKGRKDDKVEKEERMLKNRGKEIKDR